MEIEPRFMPAPGSREWLVMEALGAQVREQGNGQSQVVFFDVDGHSKGARPATALEQRMWRLLVTPDSEWFSAYWGAPNGINMSAPQTDTGE